MQTFLFYLAAVTAVLWTVLFIEVLLGNLSTKFLRDVAEKSTAPLPKVSIIIPACNEERNIEEALQSVLNQDYQNLEILVINDRSTDNTGAILKRISEREGDLRVAEINSLPQGWLGKNHALNFGAQQATGEIFLFTDADVVLHPATVSKAVTYMINHHRDHITMAPEVRMPNDLLAIFVATFGIFFSIYARPWRAKNPRSGRHIGIGAFNMIRADVYRAVGAHKAIAMRPDDDLKLGKLIKKNGYSQEFLFGKDLLYVEWYASFRELIQGLEKNSFSGVGYSVLAVIGSTIAVLLLNVFPFLAIFFTQGMVLILYAFTVFLILLLCWLSVQFHDSKRWYGIGFPFASLLMVYIVWRSMLVIYRNNGICWRGTHYSLAELKANKI
jgi:glycosyltransferase involved in cell wall biosynthesis